jgi:hypothetical protein
MSSNNIVDLSARRINPDPQDGPLRHLGAVRDLSATQLTSSLQTALAEVDDTLFEMSEKASDGTLKQQYFDDLRTLRRTRESAADRFDAALRGAFMLYAHNRPLIKHAATEALSEELSLVDEGDLEISLALSRIAARCDEDVARQRLELTKRLQFLFHRVDTDTLTPFAGSVIAEAVKAAVTELPIGLESRLVLLKRIERHLSEGNSAAIQDSNKLLFEGGVLPELKLTYTRRSGDASKSQAGDAGTGAASAGTSALPQIDLGALANEITRLLTASRPRPVGIEPGAVELDAGAVDKRLGQIRDPGTIDSQQFAQSVRQALTAGPNGEAGAAVLSDQVENAIDLVALMFDFVARDDALPKDIQQAMTPLRMPLLRSALRGAHVFDGSEHPLRALMESAAEIGRSWSPESDRDGRVLSEIKTAVANAVAESEIGAEGVERAQQDLRSFIAGEQKRAQLLEKRSAEAAQAQERRLAAQRNSQQVIADVLEQTPVPNVVGTLLNGPLRRHLELIHTRRGEESKDWKSARKLVRDIVWSFDPVTISVERTHWQAMLPNIVSALRGALSAVGMHDNDIDGVVVEFRNRYRDLVATTQHAPGSAPESFAKIDADALPDAPAPLVDAEAEPPTAEIIEHAAKTGLTYSDALTKVRTLAVGTWVELLDGKGESQRAKLIWNSTVSQRCLFVNRNGQMVADRSYQNVAGEWMLGHIKPIEDGALFERALVAVKRKLVRAQDARAA